MWTGRMEYIAWTGMWTGTMEYIAWTRMWTGRMEYNDKILGYKSSKLAAILVPSGGQSWAHFLLFS